MDKKIANANRLEKDKKGDEELQRLTVRVRAH